MCIQRKQFLFYLGVRLTISMSAPLMPMCRRQTDRQLHRWINTFTYVKPNQFLNCLFLTVLKDYSAVHALCCHLVEQIKQTITLRKVQSTLWSPFPFSSVGKACGAETDT